MLRVFILNLLLFLIPFALYALYIYATKSAEARKNMWAGNVMIYLCVAGTVVALGTIMSFVTFTKSGTDGNYRPAIVKDGKIVPGHFEKEEKK